MEEFFTDQLGDFIRYALGNFLDIFGEIMALIVFVLIFSKKVFGTSIFNAIKDLGSNKKTNTYDQRNQTNTYGPRSQVNTNVQRSQGNSYGQMPQGNGYANRPQTNANAGGKQPGMYVTKSSSGSMPHVHRPSGMYDTFNKKNARNDSGSMPHKHEEEHYRSSMDSAKLPKGYILLNGEPVRVADLEDK